MCGIGGVWHRDGRPVSKGALQRMNDVQAHRGPDDEALWMAGEVGLAHRRLGIVDPSVAGRQPMRTPDGSLWITFNGEIHDHEELRAELATAGVTFRSRSDTEVLLHAYRRWGVECFVRLNGMWAVALWDARRQELLLCRDRFGIKPLFVSERGPRVAFKLRGGWSKSVLRRAMEGVLPPEVQWRRDKKGFPAPLDHWLRRPANLRALDDLLLAPGARSAPYLDRRALARPLGRWRREPRSVGLYGRELVWRCLTLELWLRLFPDGARPAAPAAA